MSGWKGELTHCVAVAEPTPHVVGAWEVADFSLNFSLELVGGVIRATRFDLAARPGSALPGRPRRLPSDAQLINALLADERGVRLVVWLREALSEVVPADRVAHEMPREEVDTLMEQLARSTFVRRSTRPPSAAIAGEVAWLKERLRQQEPAEGSSTSTLVADFRYYHHTSEATAYRRLRCAREELARAE